MPNFAKVLRSLRAAAPAEAEDLLTQLDVLETELTPYIDIDPDQARAAIAAQQTRAASDAQLQAAIAERDGFKTQLTELQAEAVAARKETAAVRGLVSAGVRPDYEALLLPTVLTGFEVAEDGAIAPKAGLWEDLKVKYPAMFHADDAAGTGTTTTEAAASTPAPVAVTNGVISGVDPGAVLAGGVTLA